MKNKKVVYVLLPIVIIVWGIVFYRIFSVVNPSGAQFTPTSNLSNDLGVENSLVDTFTIIANYRDPFLGKVISSEKHIVGNASINIPTKPLVIPKSWPAINYGGMIKIIKSSQQTALVYINGESKMMKMGDVETEVQLLKIYADSIEVMFQKGKRMVKK